MDMRQIRFNLSMKSLGVSVIADNYQTLCDVAYRAEQAGIHISPARVEFDSETGRAYSPKSHEEGGYPSRNLFDDVCEIAREASNPEYDESRGWELDAENIGKLEALKPQLGL